MIYKLFLYDLLQKMASVLSIPVYFSCLFMNNTTINHSPYLLEMVSILFVTIILFYFFSDVSYPHSDVSGVLIVNKARSQDAPTGSLFS